MAKKRKIVDETGMLARLGRAIRSLRIAQGLSQEALAERSGLDRSYMGGIERGEHNVALINLGRIAEALGVKISNLMIVSDI